MKLIKFLLFLSIAISNGICAMDLEPKKEQLSERGKQAAQDTEVQKIIAQKILNEKDEKTKESVLEYIKKESPLKQKGGIKIPTSYGDFIPAQFDTLGAIKRSGSERFRVVNNKIIDTKNNDQIILEINEEITTVKQTAKEELKLNKNQTILFINYLDGKQELLINRQKALQWLTNKLPGQKTFLLPDQAETIRKMYEAHKNNKPFTIDMKEAIRFSEMPEYVKDMLKFYFGPLVEKKKQKEAPLRNVPQKKSVNNISPKN